MSTEILQIDIEAAQRRAERIRFHATNANEAMQSLLKLVKTAQELDDHVTLGYASWTAYVTDLFGDEPLRLARDVRRELVAELSDAGMSTRAIAPIVGVDQATVTRDIARGDANASPAPQPAAAFFDSAPDPEESLADLPDTFEYDGMTVTSTGEVIDPPAEPVTTEHTVTEKIKTVTGLDGKEYKRPEPKPRDPEPVLVGDAANEQNAKQAAREIGRSLETLLGFTFNGYRARIITEWWPLAKDEVPPSQSELFTPSQLRHIAQGLVQTATEMEAHRV